MAKLYGHLPDPPGKERGLEVGRLVGSAITLPISHTVPMPGETLDQQANNCVNCAFWMALSVAGIVANRHVDVSVTAIYALARELEQPGLSRYADVGCYPNKAIQALETWGVVARHRWPDNADPTRAVPIDVLEAGASAHVEGIFRIYETGQARLTRIRQAIAQNHAVVMATSVDAAFEDWKSGVWSGLKGSVVGGHAICIVGYRPGAFLIRNSWSKDWGETGCAWVDEKWVASPNCTDFTIVTLAPDQLL